VALRDGPPWTIPSLSTTTQPLPSLSSGEGMSIAQVVCCSQSARLATHGSKQITALGDVAAGLAKCPSLTPKSTEPNRGDEAFLVDCATVKYSGNEGLILKFSIHKFLIALLRPTCAWTSSKGGRLDLVDDVLVHIICSCISRSETTHACTVFRHHLMYH
jgi:hypothetical protein